MANARRFEWLREYQDLQNQKRFMQYKLHKRQLNLARWQDGDLKNVKINERSKAARLEEPIEGLKEQIQIIDNVMADLNEFIGTLDDLDSKIGKLKYIDGLTLEQIAEELDYSYDYIRKRHAALKRFIIVIDKFLPEEHDYTQLDMFLDKTTNIE